MFNLISKVKEINPLVLHYTNNVTIIIKNIIPIILIKFFIIY